MTSKRAALSSGAGKPCHAIGFGAMQLPGPRRIRATTKTAARRLQFCGAPQELGVDHIDTAQFYGPDVANELIRGGAASIPGGIGAGQQGWARDGNRSGPSAAFRFADAAHSGNRGQPAEAWQSTHLAAVNLRLMDDTKARPAISMTSSPPW